MNDQKIMDEQELDLLDLLWRFLEQWRGWLAFSIVFALLIPGAKYAMDMRSMSVNTPEIVESALTKLDAEADYSDVINALVAYANLKQAKEYAEKSLYMRYSSEELEHYVLTYKIEAESMDTDPRLLADVFRRAKNSDGFIAVIGDFLGEEDNPYLQELVTASGKCDNDSNRGTKNFSEATWFSIGVVVPKNADEKKFEETLTAYLNEYKKDLQPGVGEYNIEFALLQKEVLNLQEITGKKTTGFNNLTNYEKAYETATKAITDPGKLELVSRLIERDRLFDDIAKLTNEEMTGQLLEEILAEEKSGEVTATEAVASAHFNVKYVLIGFFAGVFLYGCCFLAQVIFARKMNREDELTDAIGLRNFGGIYRYPYATGFAVLLHDKAIYKLRHKGSEDETKTSARVGENVITRVRFEECSEVSRVLLGKQTAWVSETLKKQDEIIATSGAAIKPFEFEKASVELKDEMLPELKPVVLYITAGCALSEVVGLLVRFRDYNIPVLGTVFLEGPRA